MRNIMTLQHNWSEAVIRQFFTTLEVNYEKETIKWMTGRGKCTASFGEFVDVCQLDYHTMKEGLYVDKLPKVKKSEAAQLYVTSDIEYGKTKNLAMEPSLLNSMIRYTVLPKVSNSDAIRSKYYVSIKSILDGTRVN